MLSGDIGSQMDVRGVWGRMEGRRHIAGRSIRWNEAWAEQAYAAGHWSRTDFGTALARAATENPGHVVIENDGYRLRCDELYTMASRLALSMVDVVPIGSTISFMLPNWWEASVIYAASALAGMVVNPILPSLRASELRHILADADSQIIFITPMWRGFDYGAMVDGVVATLDWQPIVVPVRGADHEAVASAANSPKPNRPSFEAWLVGAAGLVLPVVDADAVQLILYTSGTSGRAKGVMHSHNSLRALTLQLEGAWSIAAGDRFYVPAPIGHIGGSLYSFEMPILLGTTAFLVEDWDAQAALTTIADRRISHMAGATIFLQQLLAAAQRTQCHLPNLKRFICGGASVPPSLIEAAQDYFDQARVTRVYGSTEVPVATIGALGDDEAYFAAHSDGRTAITHLRIVDHASAKGDGEGEIALQGPQMLVGYVHAADEADAFDRDGYFLSGDLGLLLEQRYLSVTGRAKDIIIRKGENIAPKEVEDCLILHPHIAAVAIIGLPDDDRGEMAVAVVELAADQPFDLAMLRQHLSMSGIAAFKWPERLEIWKVLPRNAAGKIVKFDIRATLLAAQKGR